MIQENKSKSTERNIGLEILRMILCFWVLLFHCIHHSNNFILNIILQKKFHVPCFFFLSFYYFFPIIKDRNSNKMKLKLERLFIPYLIWPLFIWCFNNLLYLTIEKNRFGRMISFKELKLQIITGRMFFIQLWFIFNLLILSIFFFIISFLYGYIFMLILNLVSIICYLIQHFGDNYNNSIFIIYYIHNIKIVLLIPLAI